MRPAERCLDCRPGSRNVGSAYRLGMMDRVERGLRPDGLGGREKPASTNQYRAGVNHAEDPGGWLRGQPVAVIKSRGLV